MSKWTTKEECEHEQVDQIGKGVYVQKGRCRLCRRIVYRVVDK